MPESNPSTNADESRTEKTTEISRRRVLQGAAATGALVVATGPASANGKGGQAIVREDQYYPDESFVIREVPDDKCTNRTPDGSCRDDSLVFQCRGQGGPFPAGKGGGIPFPYWDFEYESGPQAGERLKLYTRDNSIEAGLTYRWSRKEKDCPETEGYFQVGFVVDRK
jgi:hypothetical protein